jgi:hypothetical protein
MTVPTLTSGPSVTGSAHVGRTLTCTATYADAVWSGVQWLRDGKKIKGATDTTYVLRPADLGHRIACASAGYNSVGWTTMSVTPARRVLRGSSLRSTSAPVITRIGNDDTLLATMTTHDWTPTAERLTFQWSLNGTPIRHATGHRLHLIKAGKVTVTVTAHSPGYANGVAVSKPLTVT